MLAGWFNVSVFPCVLWGCWDVLQWRGSTSRASHRSTRRHWKVMGEFRVSLTSIVLKMRDNCSQLHWSLIISPQEIPPFETKGVMRASFSSRDADNHTAFIRIKTNAPNEDQFIILPVEVEVTSGVFYKSHLHHILCNCQWLVYLNVFVKMCF